MQNAPYGDDNASIVTCAVMVGALLVLVIAVTLAIIFGIWLPITLSSTRLPSSADVQLTEIVSDIPAPVLVTHAGDGSGRLYIVSRYGDILLSDDGDLQTVPFLNMAGRLDAGTFTGDADQTQLGLLSMAFHPEYAENGLFYVLYSDFRNNTTLSRYQVSDFSPLVADWASERTLVRINFDTNPLISEPSDAQNDVEESDIPGQNRGRHLAFGHDSYLYVSVGDGGIDHTDAVGKPLPSGPLLGSLLRIDVDTGDPYGIPPDNPFADGIDDAPEVWARGLRNPWRFSFDRATGDLYIGDVGLLHWEEINFQPSNSAGGQHYGWSYHEGTSVLFGEFNTNATPPNNTLPVLEYPHLPETADCAVVGGYVYRGERIPLLQTHYVFGDYCSGRIWFAYRDDNDQWQSDLLLETDYRISSFGEDEAGELYVVSYDGRVAQLTPSE